MVGQRLATQHSLTQRISPQFLKLSRLLAMSHTTLSAFLAQEVEHNPLLEYRDRRDISLSQQQPFLQRTGVSSSQSFVVSRSAKGGVPDGNMVNIEYQAIQPYTLYHHLLSQVRIQLLDVQEQDIAWLLIDHINEAGYLEVDLETLAQRTPYAKEQLEQVLLKVQHFDPAGIFARSLQECLALQLRDQNYHDPTLFLLLDHLPVLAKGKFSQLCKICGVNRTRLEALISIIRSLDPKPGLLFDEEVVLKKDIPDLFVTKDYQGEWKVHVNTETLPCISLNHRYVHTLKHGPLEEQEYFRQKVREARWLLRALRYRTKTMIRVAQEIIRQQAAFVREGIQELRPLSLQNVASVVGLHPSTISRTTADKWIQMPDGRVIALPYLFAAAVDRSLRLNSSHTVKFYIQTLIHKENHNNILSDSQLVTLLQERGIYVTRRRVSKYRQILGIPATAYRRSLKGLLNGAKKS